MYLVGYCLSLADLAVYSSIRGVCLSLTKDNVKFEEGGGEWLSVCIEGSGGMPPPLNATLKSLTCYSKGHCV